MPVNIKVEDIDWSNPKSKISKYFTVGEATFLPAIKQYHTPSKEEKETIVTFAKSMDSVREILAAPLVIHVWIRPTSVNCIDIQYKGFNYNEYIGSKALKSAHISGNACDFHVKGSEGKHGCDAIRGILIPILDTLNLRMEDLNQDWIHLDSAPVKFNRFFKP